MSGYQFIDDLPSNRDSRLTLDEYSNYYLKDSRIPDSYVIVETLSQSKESYEPKPAGTEHPSKRDFSLFEETVTDIGGGLFKISAKYAKTPDSWYGFELQPVLHLRLWDRMPQSVLHHRRWSRGSRRSRGRFFHDFGSPFCELLGHRGLEIWCCFRVRFHVPFDTDFRGEIRTLGVPKTRFAY